MKIKVVILFLLMWVTALPVQAGTEVSTFEEPDVNRVYCGKQVPYAVCRCAFQGQNCEVMNITQERAKGEVESKFRQWVGEQIEAVAKSCIDGGGQWNTATRQCITCTEGDVYYKNKCVPPEKAGEGAAPAVCVSMLEFSKDWRSFSDFAASASVNDASNEVRQYYAAQAGLVEALVERQQALFAFELASYTSASVATYLTALGEAEPAAVSAAYTTLARDMSQLPETTIAPVRELFETDVDAASSSLTVANAVVPKDFSFVEIDLTSVSEKVEDNVWEVSYQILSEYGGAVTTAKERLSNFAPLGESVPKFTDEDVSDLTKAHIASLKGDKVRTAVDANLALLRLKELKQSVATVTIYNEMEGYKAAEFKRAREQMSQACEN